MAAYVVSVLVGFVYVTCSEVDNIKMQGTNVKKELFVFFGR